MNRVIKFRAWDAYQKTMYSWAELGAFDENDRLNLWNLLNGFVENIKPLQFTGLKDKNGVEIYEGDIVTAHCFGCFGDGQNLTGQVAFDEGSCFTIEAEWSPGHITSLLFSDTSHFEEPCIEVIGNIHDNPELLK